MFKIKKLSCVGVLLGTLVVVCICGCGKNTVEYISSEPDSNEKVSEQDTSLETEQESTETVWIYVCGEVTSPGVYVLPKGSRVCDAFTAAGGFTKEAAKDYWNQARILNDGEMIYVPTEEEAKDRIPENGMGEYTDTQDRKININTASKEELMTLPGVGESKAENIIAYRNEHGEFSSIEDIMEVSGIKEGMYEKIKEYIVVN